MRQVVPELLDSLHHDDPAALRCRKELRLINCIMGNHQWVCRSLKKPQHQGCRVLELGSGDGTLARRAWSKGIVRPEKWSALDLAPVPEEWSSGAVWHQRDLMTLPVLPDAEIVVSNLFLHHLQDHELADLGSRLPKSCRTLIACEPARRWVHSLQGRLLSALVRLSHVTRHDMLVSIRSGFVGNELPRALALHGWRSVVSLTLLGAYRLTASR